MLHCRLLKSRHSAKIPVMVRHTKINLNRKEYPRILIIQKSDRQLVAAAIRDGDPSEHLKALLALPVHVENVTLKRPSFNDVFLQLTGRDLRE